LEEITKKLMEKLQGYKSWLNWKYNMHWRNFKTP
jgi:hypothetical protein